MSVVIGKGLWLWCWWWKCMRWRVCSQLQIWGWISGLAEEPCSVQRGSLLDEFFFELFFFIVCFCFFIFLGGGGGRLVGGRTCSWKKRNGRKKWSFTWEIVFYWNRTLVNDMMIKLKATRSSLLSSKPGLNICNGWNFRFLLKK